MKNLDEIIAHLKGVEDGFYGRIHIRIRAGKAVLITEERDTLLDNTSKAGREDQNENGLR